MSKLVKATCAFLTLSAIFVSSTKFYSQSTLIPLYNSINYSIEKNFISKDSSFHSCAKPFIKSEIKNTPLLDSILNTSTSINNKLLQLNILPVLDIQYGSGTSSSSLIEYSGGLSISASLGKKLSFGITGLAGNYQLVNYLDSSVSKTGIIPNFGYAYKNGNTYSFQSFSGYASYSPNKIFNFQVGKDKVFWGDGYRSLFLSDYSNNFPYAKLSATVWRIKYISLFAWLKDISNSDGIGANAKNKFGSFHLLSWNVTKRLNLNFFESIIWKGADTSRVRSFDINYLNPVVFYRPVEYSLGSSDNALVGGGFKLKLFAKHQLYGQLILDEFLLKEVIDRNGWWANKQGLQLGYKIVDLFKIKNLFIQGEFNLVRPYTYSHSSAQQNYGHFNQPLAHPLGANFTEALGIANYQYKRLSFQVKIISSRYGLDSSNVSYGKNIFVSNSNRARNYNNSTGQGLATDLLFSQFSIKYNFKSAYNFRIETGFIYRSETNAVQNIHTNMVYIGLKSSLYNIYRDF